MQDLETMPTPVLPRETDEQNRVLVTQLTDREIAEETLLYLRNAMDLFVSIGNDPMIGKMFPFLSRAGK